jgi:hypothetical protein
MLKLTQWMIPILLVVGALYLGYRYWQVSNIAAKYDEAAEIASSSLSKSGAVWTMRFESVIPKSVDEVWAALRQPERMAELQPEAFKKSTLQKEEGAKKTLEYQMALLSLPVQTLQAELTYDDAAKKARVVTSKGMQDIDAIYELQPAGEGKTKLILAGTATDKVSVPIPQSVIEGALKELFVVQVRAIKKATGTSGPEKVVAKADPTKTGTICEGEVVASGLKQVTVTVAKASGPAPAADKPEFKNATAGGYERGYLIDGVPIVETFDGTKRCTTAKAVTAGGLEVAVESVILAPESLESWVRGIDWKTLGPLPAEGADEKKLAAVMPQPGRGWEMVSPLALPRLASPLAHRAYQQQTF